MTPAEHLIARIYAIRDIVNLLASQAAEIKRAVPPDNRDGITTNVRIARRALELTRDKFSDCLTDLELRASIAALGADSLDADYHAICEGAKHPTGGLWPELAANAQPIPPTQTTNHEKESPHDRTPHD